MDEQGDLVTLKQVAEILEIPVPTARWLVQNGTLEPLRLPSPRTPLKPRVFFRRADVEKLKGGAWRRTTPRGQGREARRKAKREQQEGDRL